MRDIVIIGAGVVGSAIARELSKYDIDVLVLEKLHDVANGASKANSGIVHAGYDPRPGSLKAKLNVMGNLMFEEICRELDVPFQNNGSFVVAFDEDEIKVLEELYKRGIKNGVKEIKILNKQETLKMETNLNENIKGALYAKSAGIVSPYELTIALAENANMNGVEFKFNSEVINIFNKKDYFIIETPTDKIEAKVIINASGVNSDEINRMIGGEDIRIIPRRGEYCLLDKNVGDIVKGVIFQAPTKKGKGILVSPTVHGNLLIGPNAIEMNIKDDNSTTDRGLEEVIKGASKAVNGIERRSVITTFAGIRSTPVNRDFIINNPINNFINVAGIESPGLTAAPAIALYVVDMLQSLGLRLCKRRNFIKNRQNTKLFMHMSDEEKKIVLENYKELGRIICRCEHITEWDIVNAIKRPLGAKTVDAVKKRVRAGMGRCQGGFCMPRVMEILSRELNISYEEIEKHEKGSYILTGKTR